MRHVYRSALLIVLTFLGAACDERLSDVAGPTPNLEPRFSVINRDILQATDRAGRTACITCHFSGRGNVTGLVLAENTAYTTLLTRNGRTGMRFVTPGDPDSSYLIHKLEGRPGIVGNRMPDNGPPFLTIGQIEIIKHWIRLGAQNN